MIDATGERKHYLPVVDTFRLPEAVASASSHKREELFMALNFRQGARRVKIVGQILTGIGAAAMALFFALPSYRDFMALLVTSLFHLILPVVTGLSIWAVGWIFEGFVSAGT